MKQDHKGRVDIKQGVWGDRKKGRALLLTSSCASAERALRLLCDVCVEGVFGVFVGRHAKP